MVSATTALEILHVYAPTEAGGLDRVVEGLATAQASAGHRVAVLAIHLGERREVPSILRLRQSGVRLHETVVTPRAYAVEWRNMRRLCRELRPQIVHTHGARCDVIDGLAARSLSVPTITTLHGRTGGGLKWRVFEWTQHRAIRQFDAIIAVSRPQLDYLIADGFRGDRVHLIPNAYTPVGVPIDREKARRQLAALPGVPLIGWVGRLSDEKGVDVLIDALPLLRDLPLQVAVIGDGPRAAAVRRRAADRGVDHRIRWHGIIPDAARLFGAFDLFVLSSRTEGTPIALLEAMAGKVPVVATRVGGVPDVISEAEALLVANEDVVALAGAIRACVADRIAATERAARASRRLTDGYGTEPWLSAHEGVYRDVILRANARIRG